MTPESAPTTVMMLKDERPIMQIEWDQKGHVLVGMGGVTKIMAYGEPGEFCLVPWLAVYKGDEITMRVPAGQVMISYVFP